MPHGWLSLSTRLRNYEAMLARLSRNDVVSIGIKFIPLSEGRYQCFSIMLRQLIQTLVLGLPFVGSGRTSLSFKSCSMVQQTVHSMIKIAAYQRCNGSVRFLLGILVLRSFCVKIINNDGLKKSVGRNMEVLVLNSKKRQE